MSLNKTLIEWVKNPDGTQGYTWNPITGCLNGCEYCYARKLANTRLKVDAITVSRWERGEQKPSAQAERQLARLLKRS